ncbi:TIGR00730 family Rossman fold protein [Legionella maceachernii]|uniref:Cytokinin riboside 5'-monophosphate phosphoribohydrolase n=1 Tax=Legionella maceachernii TaxID=466 RepID=A0A0W0W3R0_9GAMM|nr:TIGR00730 family Rossman fold protein [Legionella maceachernii]KTD27035.1 lysine decarboxylase [Legionella maceachernii]SKA03674.1 hypothetical protein SAMN02745128_01841 [Legionella maceachernii]SUP00200.1 LOG family protein yvdD [Legionella maceachernii]
MKSIGVYLGAHYGNDNSFRESVITLAKEITNLGLVLVYGGSSLGLMGLLANSVKAYGGKVIGITTHQLIEKEQPLDTLDELYVVNSMQERKQILQQKSDMFVVMPGGLGTLEEACETWNAIKIGLFNKPIGFLNVAGYFNELFAFIHTCEKTGFLSEEHKRIPKINADIKLLLGELIENLEILQKNHYKRADNELFHSL